MFNCLMFKYRGSMYLLINVINFYIVFIDFVLCIDIG